MTDKDWLKNASVADFIAPAQHIYEHQTPGGETLEDFIARHVDSLYMAIAVADGEVNPVMILGNDRMERLFVAEEEDTLATYIDRLRVSREAIDAHRVFFARGMNIGVDMATPGARTIQGVMWVVLERGADLGVSLRTGAIEIKDGRPVATLTANVMGGPLRDHLYGLFDTYEQ